MEIGILGLWHLGCIYATSLASLGYRVTGFDLDPEVTRELINGHPPIFEPGLNEKLKESLDKNLRFSFDASDAIKNKKYIFVTIDTPVDENDELNIEPVRRLIKLISHHCSTGSIIIISSQIPTGTTRRFERQLKSVADVEVIYFPENIRLGNAYQTFLSPDRIVLGSASHRAINKFKKDFSFFKCPMLEMSFESAEMVKHALNAFLATTISFTSEICDLCEEVGGDYKDILQALKMDKRIGFAPINPGTGFAGGTLGRDVKALLKIATNVGYNPKLLSAVYEVNSDRLKMILKKVKTIFPSPKNKIIGILGLTYKPNTNTLRRSLSLALSTILKSEVAGIIGYDPAISTEIVSHPHLKICTSLDDFFTGLDLAIVMTPWPEFRNITSSQINKMRHKLILDTNNILNPRVIKKSEVKYFGRGTKNLSRP